MTEVDIRTLSSDLQSTAHGAPAPVAESVKIASSDTSENDGAIQPAQTAHRNIGRNIFMIILLIAIGVAGYLYLYPALMASLTPQTVVH